MSSKRLHRMMQRIRSALQSKVAIAKSSRKKRRRSMLETLERREMFAADLRSFDGTGNNLANPQWGSTDEAFLRLAPAEYADGKSTPAGADRASARLISNLVANQGNSEAIDERGMSAFVYAWGQFIDHDIDLTPTGSAGESFAIKIPIGDAFFDPNSTGTKTMSLTRSEFAANTGVNSPRQQLNEITAFIDGSMVYGSDLETANSLRTFSGGKLKTSAGNLLPMQDGSFVAGDIRVSENPELTAMHTLFLREHNRIADRLAAEHRDWNDEKLYQEARRMVIGEIQAITYNEFLPAVLGENAIRPYRGYNSNVNPGIANEFATAAFRLGHSMLGSDIEFLDNNGNEVRDPVALRDAFFNTSIVQQEGIDEILKYLASDNSMRIDTRLIDDVRNFLFGPPGSGGFDLAALNIQRGRDHGLADYNDVRKAYGLTPVRSFADITKNVEVQRALQQAYGNVNNIDLWVGGLAEDHVPGAAVGPLFQRIIADQFMRIRDGDRFWYERDLSGSGLISVKNTTLADVIRRNSATSNLQSNVFFFQTGVQGRVFVDANSNGRIDGRETGAAGHIVELRDASGVVVATTQTKQDGFYRFEQFGLGNFTVVVKKPASGSTPASDLISRKVSVTKGGLIDRFDLALVAPPTNGGGRPTGRA